MAGVRGRGSDEIKLNVISIAVDVKAMAANEPAKRKDVYEKENGTKYGTLGDTTSDRGRRGLIWTKSDKLLSVGEV